MTHKQVEEMINEYFDALLGAKIDFDEAKDSLTPSVPASPPAEPNHDSDSKHTATALTNEPTTVIAKKMTQTPSPIIAPIAEPMSEKTVSPSMPLATGSAYEQHKERLEKMLQQVSALETKTELPSATHIPEKQSIVDEPEADRPTEKTNTQIIKENVSDEVIAPSDAGLAYSEIPPLSSEWLDNGRPNWAQEQFDILLVEVNGLRLAVPLVALGQIQTMDEHLTPLFGQSDWFMGLQKSPIGNIKTVNTAKFVMPERYQNQHDYKYVVSINGLHWGLAVDRIDQPISISPASIRWRVKRSSRPWMAGMVKDHMCVLLDIPALGDILQKQDKNQKEQTGGKG